MKKLRLDLDTLALDSFDTADDKGNVRGHFVPTNPWCAGNTYKTYCPDTLCTCPPPIY